MSKGRWGDAQEGGKSPLRIRVDPIGNAVGLLGHDGTPKSANEALTAHLASMGLVGPTYPLAPLVDLDTSKWSKVDGGGVDASVSVSPVKGFSVRLKNNDAITGYVAARRAITPITLATEDSITLELNIPDASSTRNITFRLLVDTAGRKFDVSGFETWHAGRNTVSFRVGDMTPTGGALITDTFNYIQVDMVGPTSYAKSLEIDVGRVWIGGAARTPLCCITFDAAYAKVYSLAYKYMRDLGLVGNLYAMSSTVGSAGHMTLAEYREVVAAGWGLGLYGHVPNLGANSHDVTGVATAQSLLAGASFAIDGTYAFGGIATFDVPRYVTVVLSSGNDNANSYLITGTDKDGRVYSEHVRGCSAAPTKVVTKGKFSTVSSVVARANTAGPVSIGTAMVGSDLIATIKIGQAWLKDNGFSKAVDWAYPYGETNNDSEETLRNLGILTARTVVIGGPPFLEPCPGTARNLYFAPCAVTLGDNATAAALKTKIDNQVARGYDFFILGHLSDAGPTNESELKTSLAYLSLLHRSGMLRVVSFDDFRRIRGIA